LQEPKKQNYLKGAAILAAAAIFVKIIGAVYKIPIFNILDDAGIGSFQVTYSVYTLILTISTAGIPAALSRLVSAASASGNTSLVRRYFSVSLPAFMLIGVIAMLAMFLFADNLAGFMGDSLSANGIRVLAPAVLFVCVISVYRGYAQGFENMIPTAVSQVIEVICKAAFGLIAAMWLSSLNYASHLVSAGAIMGVTVGLGLCVPLLIWYKKKLDRGLPAADGITESSGKMGVLAQVMKVSIPITLSASFMAIMTVIDQKIVLGRLQELYTVWHMEIPVITEGLAKTAAEALARSQFGMYARGLTVYNLPYALVVPVSVSIIPAISAALAKGRGGEAGKIMQSSVKLVNLLAMPAGAGIAVLASPIMMALYNDPRQLTSTMMAILGAASFFVCLQYITTAVLQATGNERVSMVTFFIGAVLKIVLVYVLAGNPDFGIVGSPIGTLACFIVISSLNIVFIILRVKDKPKFGSVFIKPALCTAAMAGTAFVMYRLLHWFGSGIIGTGRFAVVICLAVSIVSAIAVYGVLIIVTRTITKEDMALIPKGEKLAKVLRIR